MAQKYTLNSNTTTGDRLAGAPSAAIHLSDGSCVMIVKDPNAADPLKFTLQLIPASAHTTPSVIATLSCGAVSNGYTFSSAGNLALCRDSSDNLYVLGADGGGATTATIQAFMKISGSLAWFQQTANVTGAPTYLANGMTNALWVNSGGGTNGAGHILGQYVSAPGNTQLVTYDAGAALLGSAQPSPGYVSLSGSTFTNQSVVSSTALDLVGDGFGTTSGLAVCGSSTASYVVSTWSVSATGSISYGQAPSILATLTGGTIGATTQSLVIRVSSNRFAVMIPSSTHAGQINVTWFSATAQLGAAAGVDSGTSGNFPAPAAGLSWNATTNGASLYLFGWSSLTAQTLLQVAYTFPADVITLGATSTVDTSVGSGTNTTIRAVNQPIDVGHIDIQAYNTTSPFSLLGDFAAEYATANVPILGPPATNTSEQLSGGGTMAWTFNPASSGDTQSAYSLRRQASGGAVQFWSGSAWGSVETYITSSAQSIAYAAANWAASTTYAWSVATKGQNGVTSGYAPNFIVFSSPTLPTTPTLTATYDSANNRVSLTVTGTGTDTAEFQVSRDGGTTWTDVRGAGAVALVAGAATVYDYEAPPNVQSKYRVAQKDGSAGNYAINSAWSTVQNVTPAPTSSWLRDPAAGTVGLAINIRDGSLQTEIVEKNATHWPLGSKYPTILADTLKGESGGAIFFTKSTSDETALAALMAEQVPLLLQTIAPDNRQWYIRITDRQKNVPGGLGKTLYIRDWSVKWDEVAAP